MLEKKSLMMIEEIVKNNFFFFPMINYLNCLSKLEKGNAKREAVLTCSTLFVLLKHTTFRVSSCGFVAAEFVYCF